MYRPIVSWKELQPKYLIKIPIFELWITLHKCTQPVIFNLPIHCSPELDALTSDETFDEEVITVLYFLSEWFYSCLTLWLVSVSWCWLETFNIASKYVMWLLSVPLTCRLLLCETKTIKYYNPLKHICVATRGLHRAGSVRPARLVPVPAGTGFRD